MIFFSLIYFFVFCSVFLIFTDEVDVLYKPSAQMNEKNASHSNIIYRSKTFSKSAHQELLYPLILQLFREFEIFLFCLFGTSLSFLGLAT